MEIDLVLKRSSSNDFLGKLEFYVFNKYLYVIYGCGKSVIELIG